MKASFWILLEIIVLGVLIVQSMVNASLSCFSCWFIMSHSFARRLLHQELISFYRYWCCCTDELDRRVAALVMLITSRDRSCVV